MSQNFAENIHKPHTHLYTTTTKSSISRKNTKSINHSVIPSVIDRAIKCHEIRIRLALQLPIRTEISR